MLHKVFVIIFVSILYHGPFRDCIIVYPKQLLAVLLFVVPMAKYIFEQNNTKINRSVSKRIKQPPPTSFLDQIGNGQKSALDGHLNFQRKLAIKGKWPYKVGAK